MKMFWRPCRNDRWEELWDRVVLMKTHTHSNLLTTRDIAVCDGCGCLVVKREESKQPSTVDRAAPHPAAPFSEPKEIIIEHYLCGRCAPKKDGV